MSTRRLNFWPPKLKRISPEPIQLTAEGDILCQPCSDRFHPLPVHDKLTPDYSGVHKFCGGRICSKGLLPLRMFCSASTAACAYIFPQVLILTATCAHIWRAYSLPKTCTSQSTRNVELADKPNQESYEAPKASFFCTDSLEKGNRLIFVLAKW